MRLSRKQFVRLVLGVPVLGVLVVSYMRWFEPHWQELTKKDLKIRKLEQPLRLLHLSDFHVTSEEDLEAISKAIKLGLGEQPDLAVITEDFFTTTWDDTELYAACLRTLTDTVPTFACAGNHDGGSWAARASGYENLSQLERLLDSANIRLLRNETSQITIKNQSLNLVGLGDIWSREFNPATVTELQLTTGPSIVLSHNPDTKELLQSYDWDLICCGHTHGGQLVVPLLGWRPFLPVRDSSFPEGILSRNDRHIHITRGVGNLQGLRFNCRPEVSILNLS